MSKHTPGPWRTGRKVGRTIYADDKLIGVMDRVEDARVAALAPEMMKVLGAASHALKSYSFGNASTVLGAEIALAIDIVLARTEGESATLSPSVTPAGPQKKKTNQPKAKESQS